jgi:fibronectin-binding autotransporter adhesin
MRNRCLRKKCLHFMVFFAAMFVALGTNWAGMAIGDTLTWTGLAGDENWETPGNWNPARVPFSDDDVVLSLYEYIRYDGAGTTVKSLSLSNIAILVLNGPMSAGTVSLANGAIYGTGVLTASGSFTITGESNTWQGKGITLGNGVVLQNNGRLFIQPNLSPASEEQQIAGGTNARLENQNNGRIYMSQASNNTVIQVPFDNAGSVFLESKVLILKGGNSGATANNGYFSIQISGNYGKLQFDGGIYYYGNNAILDGTLGREVEFKSGTVNFDGFYGVPWTNVTGGTFNFTGNMNLSLYDHLTISSGTANFDITSLFQVKNLTQSGGTLAGPGLIKVTQQLLWEGGTMEGPGTTEIEITGGVYIQGAAVKYLGGSQARTLEITSGTVYWTQGDMVLGSGSTFHNKFYGIIDFRANAHISATGSPAARFLNEGTFKRSTGTGTATIGVPFTNSGSVQATAGILAFTDTYIQQGSYGTTLLNGGAIQKTGSPFNLLQGGLRGYGTITGNVANGGQVNPGLILGAGDQTNTLTIDGDYSDDTTPPGAMWLEIGGPNPGDYDALAVTGTATFKGAFNATLIDGYTPAPAQTFTVLTAASRSGTFTQTNLPAGFTIEYTTTSVILHAPLSYNVFLPLVLRN